MSAREALERLREGNRRFASGELSRETSAEWSAVRADWAFL